MMGLEYERFDSLPEEAHRTLLQDNFEDVGQEISDLEARLICGRSGS